MYRETLPDYKINLFFDNGGLGDSIARLPVIPWILHHYPFISVNLFVFDYFVPFAKNALRDFSGRVNVIKWSDAKKYYDTTLYTKSLGQTYPTFDNLHLPMTEHAFIIVTNKIPEQKNIWYNYPTLDLSTTNIDKYNLPKRYIVVTTAFTAPAREFLPQHVNTIVSEIKASGYDVVFLGQKQTVTGTPKVIEGQLNSDIDFSQGYDLIDKTSLLEAAKILGEAEAVVGLDNGLLHLAAATPKRADGTLVPIIAGFTSVDPKHREPWRFGEYSKDWYSVTPKNLECAGCQSNMIFTLNHDFRNCIYEDLRCVKELTADIYLEKLWQVLKKNT